MSFWVRLSLWAAVLAVGGVAVVVETLVMVREPASEGKLTIHVQANPTPDTFAGVVEGATRIVNTLAELSTFDRFRTMVLQSGFGIDRSAFGNTPEEVRTRWKRRVHITRIDDTLVLRVRAQGTSAADAVRLTSATLHALALEAPTIVGNHVVRAEIERRPAIVAPLSESVQILLGLVGALGIVVGANGLLSLFSSRWKEAQKQALPPVATPSKDPTPSPIPRSSPEEAREWLKQFFEEHRRSTRPTPDTIMTWDDVPGSSQASKWLKPPDTMLV